LASSGCVSVHHALVGPESGPHVLFVADGAGNSQNCSKHLRAAAAEVGQRVQVAPFDWGHDKTHYLIDHLDYDNLQAAGGAMAGAIDAFQRQHPHTPIYLAGYSTGCAVVLKALEHLPPATVERVFLLVPSVSAEYDLSTALPAVRQQVHVHYSPGDWLWMGLGTDVVGTADRRWGPTAARFGFRCLAPGACAKVCQRSWQPEDQRGGHNGGHFGVYGHGFLRAQVLSWLP